MTDPNLHHLDREKASQLALIMSSGCPAEQAMGYFLPDLDPVDRGPVMRRWLASEAFAKAVERLQGKSWQAMSLEERIRYAIDKHYTEHAYFLYTNNYVSLTGAERQKADTCRAVLEAKLAGLAGKGNPLDNFWQDLVAGRISLPTGPVAAPILTLPTPPAGGGSES
jgi:hypothetical protein